MLDPRRWLLWVVLSSVGAWIIVIATPGLGSPDLGIAFMASGRAGMGFLWLLAASWLAVPFGLRLLGCGPDDLAPKQWQRACLLNLFGFLLVSLLALLIAVPLAPSSNIRVWFSCSAQVREVMRALREYRREHGSFPPAYLADESGRPAHSWRVLLLPYLDKQALFDQYRFDEPWNGPNNRKLADEIPWNYQCPLHRRSSRSIWGYWWARPEADQGATHLLLTGPGTMFLGADAPDASEPSDGEDRTLMVVEYAGANANWLEPTDLPLDQFLAAPAARLKPHHGPFKFNFSAGFADGEVQGLPATIDPEVRRQLADPRDGLPASDRDDQGRDD